MKNKKNIYILLPIVLLIWGLVIYKFFSFSNSDGTTVETIDNFEVKPLVIKPRDTFLIKVNYRDPFLGKMYMPVKTKVSNHAKKKVEPKTPVIWPQIIYKGIVSDNKDKKKVFMIIINGQTYLMSEKDTEQEVTLKSGSRASINVKYKDNMNVILIQE